MTMTPLVASDGSTWYARLREQLPSGSGGTFRWRKLAEGELSVSWFNSEMFDKEGERN